MLVSYKQLGEYLFCVAYFRRLLTPYIDGELDALKQTRVQRHLGKCERCQREYDHLLFASRVVSHLILPVEPPTGMPAWFAPVRVEDKFRSYWRPWKILVPFAAATLATLLIAVVLIHRRHMDQQNGSLNQEVSWNVVRLAGTPLINSSRMSKTNEIKVGDWLETDKSSRALLNMGILGQVEVDPDTRIRLVESRSNEQRLSITRGRVYATILAPPRIFFIETPSGIAIDLGCAYTLEVDESGQSTVYVFSGGVAFAYRGRESTIPANMACRARPGSGPGTPYDRGASESFQNALAEFDFESGGSQALQKVLAETQASDALTLWNLLKRVEGRDRDRVYEKLARFVPPPDASTKEGILRLDQPMLDLWLQKVDEARAGHESKRRPAPGTIRLTGNMEVDRSWHRAILLPNGKVLVTGGLDSYGNALASAELYDPATGEFTDAGKMNSRRYAHSATLLKNGKVLFVGGGEGKETRDTLSSAEIYDPNTGLFTPTGMLKTARLAHEATLLADGRVLITGGMGGNGDASWLASAEIYDPATETFNETGKMREARVDHTATLLNNGKTLIAGGYGNTGARNGVTSSAELYDPQTGSFSLVSNMNFHRFKHSAVLLNDGKVLIVGGIASSSNPRQYTTAELFDPATNSFVNTGDMVLDRYKVRNAAVRLQNGKVFIAGGSWGFEIYDPATGTFSMNTGRMNMTRYYSTATLLPNGDVVIIGGYSGIQPEDFYHSSASAWIYSP